MARSKKSTKSSLKALERELVNDLKKHIISEEVIKISPNDFEYINYYEGIKLGINDKVKYSVEGVATRTNYTKTKKTITTYDDEGKELIKTYLSKINDNNNDKKKRVVGAKSLNSNNSKKKFIEMLKAFIKYDRMLNEIENNKTNGMYKAKCAINMYLRSPLYIPIAVIVYSLILNIKPNALVGELKKDETFINNLKSTGYYDVVMSKIDKSYMPDLEKTQIIMSKGRGI